MADLYIFRKTDTKLPKLGVKQLAEAQRKINRRCKVHRNDVVDFFLTGKFNKLPVVKQAVIDTPYVRDEYLDYAWKVPVDQLGRVGEATPSTRESLRIWIRQSLATYGVDPESFAVVYDDQEA